MARLTPELRTYIEKTINESTLLTHLKLGELKDLRATDHSELKFVQLQLYDWATQKVPVYLRDNGLIYSRTHSGQQIMSLNTDRVPDQIHQNLIHVFGFLGRVASRYNSLSQKEIQYDLLHRKYPSVNYVLKELNRNTFAFLKARSVRSAG